MPNQPGSKLGSEMAGSCLTVLKPPSQWIFHLTIPHFQTSQKDWNKFFQSVVSMSWDFMENARIAAKSLKLKYVVANIFSHYNLISRHRSHSSKKSLRMQVIFQYSYPSFTVSWILLNSSGAWSRSISVRTVTSPMTHLKKTCQRVWGLSQLQQFGDESTAW